MQLNDGVVDTCRRWFQEFIRLETEVGGPDPHMKIALEIAAEREDPSDQAWFLGCYLCTYTVAMGEVIADAFPTPWSVLSNPDGLDAWLAEHWGGLAWRKEARARRVAQANTVAYLMSYATLVVNRLPEMKASSFDQAWGLLSELPFNGRYFTVKLYEALHRADFLPEPFPDIRPKGGKSPRQMLALLYPDQSTEPTKNKPEDIALANALATEEKARLRDEAGLDLTWYTLRTFLCEAKSMLDGGQYPGRAHDSELGHVRKVAAHFPDVPLKTLAVRNRLFPHEALGEVQGWNARRNELGPLPMTENYMWVDTLYDYVKTTDLSKPVLRDTARVPQQRPERENLRSNMKLHRMTDQLFTRGKLTDGQVGAVLEGGYAVVALTPRPNRVIQDALGPRYHHAPVVDSKVSGKNLNAVMAAVDRTVEEVRAGRRVIVHCNAGKNRAPLVAALTLRVVNGWSGPEAMAYVRSVRGGAIANPWFEAYLEVVDEPRIA